MDDKILVSTITPCFRMKKYLKVFLDELPKQTMFKNIEVVLDHNEPDEEEVLWIKEFQNKYPGRLKHIIIDKVDPIGVSMNRCIKESSGECLTIWNVDDLRTVDSIENQYRKMKENNDYGIVYGNFKVVRKFNTINGRLIRFNKYKDSEFSRSMIFGPFFMFKKDLCDKAGYFDEQLKSGADFDFSVRLALISQAVMVDNCLGYYLNEGLGASTRPGSLQAIERTVIELRYGIYDKIDFDYLKDALNYNIYSIRQFSKDYLISNLIPDFSIFLMNREKKWLKKGLRNNFYNQIINKKKIKVIFKRMILFIFKIIKYERY